MAKATFLKARVGDYWGELECKNGKIGVKVFGPRGPVVQIGPKALGVECNQVDAEEAVSFLRKPQFRNPIPEEDRRDYDAVVNALDHKIPGSGLPRHPPPRVRA